MADVVNLNPRFVGAHERLDREPNKYVVEKLEELLVEARAGNIVGIAYVTYHAPNDVDQQIGYNHCGRMRVVSVIGGLHMLSADMIRDEMEAEDAS